MAPMIERADALVWEALARAVDALIELGLWLIGVLDDLTAPELPSMEASW
jgi:hypothetical protein